MTQSRYINFIFETQGAVSPEQEEIAREAFSAAGTTLETEWRVLTPITINVCLMSDTAFRDGAAPTDPTSWRYCFLLRDQTENSTRIYCNVDIFQTLPQDAAAMITHETAHAVVGVLVGDITAYKKSFFFEEGTAGLEQATNRLIAKLRQDPTQSIPNPLTLKTIADIRTLGGDTNKEPFTEQLGYLALFSAAAFLRDRHGEGKIIETYRRLGSEHSLEDAYQAVCKESLKNALTEWRATIQQALLSRNEISTPETAQ